MLYLNSLSDIKSPRCLWAIFSFSPLDLCQRGFEKVTGGFLEDEDIKCIQTAGSLFSILQTTDKKHLEHSEKSE